MLKESDKELFKVPGILALLFGRFLYHSMREPVEYALDQISSGHISSKTFRRSIMMASVAPGLSIASGTIIGSLNENPVQGVTVGLFTWMAAGMVLRIAHNQDYG